MTERPDQDIPTESFADLPLQPTGSGVADLEVAYEQMKLAEAAEATSTTVPMPDAEVETVAHPS